MIGTTASSPLWSDRSTARTNAGASNGVSTPQANATSASPVERHEARVERGERPVVGDRIVDHDRVERRQLLPRRAHDADRAVADSLAHDRDRVLDGRLPVPVEERLGLAHPARPAAGENDRSRPHVSQGRAPARAGSRSGP